MRIDKGLRAVALGGALLAVGEARAADLPSRADHTLSSSFPPIIKQQNESCSQEAAIHTMLGYEWNRLHGSWAETAGNRLASPFVWRMVNGGGDRGSELAEGLEIAARMGVPPLSVWEGTSDSLDALMHGYERYHAAMRRRVIDYQFKPLTNATELEELKRRLALGASGAAESGGGGVAAFEQRLRGARFGRTLCGKTCVEAWGSSGAGHVMTYAGYDDTIGIDRDGDGVCRNDRDLDGDGVIDLRDWEKGALLAVNSFGTEWGDGGKVWVPYHLVGDQGFRRGRWVAVAEMAPEYRPRWTLKLRFTCRDRSRLAIKLIDDQGRRHAVFPFLHGGPYLRARQPESPEKYSGFVTGKLRLGALPPRGKGDFRPIEMGFDLTGILDGNPESWRLALGGGGSGKVFAASLLLHGLEGSSPEEFPLGTVPASFGNDTVILRASATTPGKR